MILLSLMTITLNAVLAAEPPKLVPGKIADSVQEVSKIKPKDDPNSKGSATPAASSALTPSVPAPQSAKQLAEAVSQTAEQAPDFSQIRDPFKQPAALASNAVPKTALETFPVDTLKMMAVMSGPRKIKALVKAPDGKNYIVMEKMKVGLRGGVIAKITASAILIREKLVNIVGEEEDLETILKMEVEPSKLATESMKSEET